METAFTPVASLIGGAMIGAAAVALMAFLGRIMGATGIVAGLFGPANISDWLWRASFVAGAVAAPLAMLLATGSGPTISPPSDTVLLIGGGLLVGVGVTLGSGCTSGHGVCGLARFSKRSIAATLTFMAATAATVYLLRHVF